MDPTLQQQNLINMLMSPQANMANQVYNSYQMPQAQNPAMQPQGMGGQPPGMFGASPTQQPDFSNLMQNMQGMS